MKYQITISGSIDESWRDWLEVHSIAEVTLSKGLPATELVCTVQDQPELRAIMNKLWNLNLSIRKVVLLAESKK